MKVIQAKRKDLGNPSQTSTKKDDTIVDKGAEDPPCTNYQKRKMLDKETDAWTVHVKKSRVSVRVLMTSLSYGDSLRRASASSFVMGRSGRG